jgi:hypothetical protein
MTHLARSRRHVLLAVGALVLGAFLLPAAPARAATQLTWTAGHDVPGADHHSWSDPLNWSPQQVPDDGDAVTVGAVPGVGATYVDGIPSVELSALVVAGTAGNAVHLGTDGEKLTVTDSFTWTGGEIVADVHLGSSAHGTITAGGPKSMSGDLTVAGDLTLDHLGADAFTMRWGHRLTVAAGAELTSTGDNHLGYDRCCTTPNRLVSQGTLDVADGTLWLEGIELDHSGTASVADGATLRTTIGPVRMDPGAAWAGPGTVRFEDTTSPDPADPEDPVDPDASQGAILVTGTNTLSDGVRMEVADGSAVTGTGTLTGTGALTLDGSVVYADLTLDRNVSLDVAGPDASRLGVWDPDLAGYHAHLTVTGAATVPAGAELDLDNGTLTTVTRGGSVTVAGGGTIGSRTCCSTAPELVTTPTGSLVLGGGDQPATLRWIHIRTQGRTRVPAGAGVDLVKTAVDQRAGSTTLGSRSTVSAPDLGWRLLGGVLTGAGHLAGAVDNTGGTVAPGLGRRPGTVRFDGYRQGRHGTLALTLAGRRADRLVVAGAAALDGRLTARGSLAAGRTVTVVTGRPVSGRFAKVAARHATVQYAGGRVSLHARR